MVNRIAAGVDRTTALEIHPTSDPITISTTAPGQGVILKGFIDNDFADLVNDGPHSIMIYSENGNFYSQDKGTDLGHELTLDASPNGQLITYIEVDEQSMFTVREN